MPMDKAILSEDHPGYIGLYNGDYSSPSDVKTIVERADLILDVGGVVFQDLNTGLWSDVRIPDQSCHLFQPNAATHSISKLPPIPVNAATH